MFTFSKHTLLLVLIFTACAIVRADVIYFDQAHGQRPNSKPAKEITAALNHEVYESTEAITKEKLDGVSMLYLRAPTEGFTQAEVKAVIEYVRAGGSLLLVLDQERRQSLAKVNVNEMIIPFGMMLTQDTPYLHNTGAIAPAGEISPKLREVPYSGGRAVAGGNAFAYQLDKQGNPGLPFAAWKKVEGGGKIIVMADAMATLFMGVEGAERLSGVPGNPRETTYWGPDSYAFMKDVFTWLVKL